MAVSFLRLGGFRCVWLSPSQAAQQVLFLLLGLQIAALAVQWLRTVLASCVHDAHLPHELHSVANPKTKVFLSILPSELGWLD